MTAHLHLYMVSHDNKPSIFSRIRRLLSASVLLGAKLFKWNWIVPPQLNPLAGIDWSYVLNFPSFALFLSSFLRSNYVLTCSIPSSMDTCSSPGCCSKSCDLSPAFTPCHMWSSWGTAHEGEGCDQSIGLTVSDAIVRIWLWSTVNRSSIFGYFSRLLQVVDSWPHILWL